MLGDGYSAAERRKFEKDARRAVEILFSRSPFKEHRKDFNVWGLCPAAAESGIARPSTGLYRDSPIGASYDTFGSERYVMTTNNHALREVASYAPYEFIEILVDRGTYGGGGIFNLYATVAIDSQWAPYLFVHEFGHQFADRRRVLHLRRGLRVAISAHRAVGTECHCVARSREAEVERPCRRRHAPSHTLAKGGVRSLRTRHPGRAAQTPGREPA